MARLPRFKVEGIKAWYHLRGQVTGHKSDRLLQKEGCQQKLIDLIKHYQKVYFCDASALSIMGTHYHLIIKFDPFKEVSIATLKKRALILGTSTQRQIDNWSDEQWVKFRKRLFNISEFMRNLQSTFARWYNETFERAGKFWADRFKSSILADDKAVLDCMLYVDLNPVRAGMVKRPEAHTGSSIHLRHVNLDEWLVPLEKVLPVTDTRGVVDHIKKKMLECYRCRLYYRGNVPSKKGQAKIPDTILEQELAHGFKAPGMYRQRLRYFIDGLFIGNQSKIKKLMGKLSKKSDYLQDKIPISHPDGEHHSLRPLREVMA